ELFVISMKKGQFNISLETAFYVIGAFIVVGVIFAFAMSPSGIFKIVEAADDLRDAFNRMGRKHFHTQIWIEEVSDQRFGAPYVNEDVAIDIRVNNSADSPQQVRAIIEHEGDPVYLPGKEDSVTIQPGDGNEHTFEFHTGPQGIAPNFQFDCGDFAAGYTVKIYLTEGSPEWMPDDRIVALESVSSEETSCG
ncbi:MAG: hypothetical protein SVU32_01745, partial [Candidatus Nanohaloarchaea archaeon]|nr:hypothetical protein [Candidatus Nanohaloarchaea archaeon]